MAGDKTERELRDEIARLRIRVTELEVRNRGSGIWSRDKKLSILSTVIEQSTSSIVILDADETILYANPHMVEGIGLEVSDLLGQDWQQFVPEESFLRQKLPEIRRIVREEKRIWKGEVWNYASTGEIIWRQATVFPIVEPDGEVMHFVYSSEDITEQKRAETLLKVQRDLILAFSESRDLSGMMDALLSAALDLDELDAGGVYLRDILTGDLNLVSHQGLSPDFVETVSHYDADSPQARLVNNGATVHGHYSELAPELGHLFESHLLRAISVIPLKHEGVVRGALNIASFTLDELPKTSRHTIETIAGMAGDAIVRAQAESALRESEERYRKLVNLGPDVVGVVQGAKIVYANKSFEKTFGYTEDDVKKGLDVFDLIVEKDHERIKQRMRNQQTGTRQPRTFRVDMKAKDGRIVPCETVATTIQHEGHEANLVNVRDLSDRLEAERERQRLAEQLRQAEKMEAIGQLAGGIAHNFNNQLAGMAGFADLIRARSKDNPQIAEYAQKISMGIKRAADSTSGLLAFARKGKYVTESVDIHALLLEVVSLLETSIDKRIQVSYRLEALEHNTIGDASQLQSAILNLGLNARDAIDGEGEIIFSTDDVSMDPQTALKYPLEISPGNYLTVSVTDNGAGMKQDVQRRIFEPFFTTKPHGKGTGMGLAAVYGTIKNHKGAVDVVSESGKGTTFTLYLPVAKPTPQEDNAAEVVTMVARETATILLVDDEDYVREMASELILSLGYRVEACSNGHEALKRYERYRGRYDLVILDMVMAGMSGLDTFLALKKIDPEVRVLLSSGYSLDSDAQAVLQDGAGGFLQKPFGRAQLSKRIAELLNES